MLVGALIDINGNLLVKIVKYTRLELFSSTETTNDITVQQEQKLTVTSISVAFVTHLLNTLSHVDI